MSDSEISDFLSIVQELPGNQFPEFEPAGIPRVQPDQGPEAALIAWREAYRRSCDPANLAMSWYGNADLEDVLARRGYSPEEFAHLVRRISLAITAASLADRIDFVAVHQQVQQQIEEMTQAIHQLDVVPDPTLSPEERLRRREAMLHALQETAALGEFLRMLSDVPAEARTVAQRRRSDLEPYLPANGNQMAQFERILESRAEVVPATHWQPQ